MSPMNNRIEPQDVFRALPKTPICLLEDPRYSRRRYAMKWEDFRQSDNIEDRRGDGPMTAAAAARRRAISASAR